MAKPEWSGKTDGTRGMQKSLIWVFRWVDVRVFYAVMSVVIVGYMILCPCYTRAQYRYLRYRQGMSRWQSIVGLYRLFYQFGMVVMDRFASYAGQRFKLVGDTSLYDEMASHKEGAVIIQSHIGNYEMAGYQLSTKKRINVLAFGGETEVVNENRSRLFERGNIHLIHQLDDMSHVLEVYRALDDGEVVSMPGDRIYGSQKSLEVDLMGAKAHLPEGPFRMIDRMGVEAIAIVVMKEKWDTYRIIMQRLKKVGKDRIEREKNMAQEYADFLTRTLREFPYQWYHFFEFWKA